MIILNDDNFINIQYESPDGTIKETHAEVTIRIAIKDGRREDIHDLVQQIIHNGRIRKELEYRAEHPIALNYASFEQWVIELLVPESKEHNRDVYLAKVIENEKI